MSEVKLEISFKTPSKVQLTAMASRLKLSTDDVLGKCVRLWLWAKINTDNGFIANSTFATLDDCFQCPGFAAALDMVGWLRAREGGLEFPSYDRLCRVTEPVTSDVSVTRGDAPVTPSVTSPVTSSAERTRKWREKQRHRNVTETSPSVTEPVTSVTPRSLSSSSSGAEGSGGKKAPSKAKIFIPPTVEEVSDYCRERSNKVDAAQFVDHYQANGWVQASGQKIRDWKAAVRTWEKNEFRPKKSAGLFDGHQQWLRDKEQAG